MAKTAMKSAPAKGAGFKVTGTYGTMYYVKDMASAVAWYRERLGIKPGFESPEWTEFRLGGHALCLHLAGKDKGFANGALIFSVEGIRALVDDMRGRGARVVFDVHEVHPGAHAADVADPDGNVIGLYEGPRG